MSPTSSLKWYLLMSVHGFITENNIVIPTAVRTSPYSLVDINRRFRGAYCLYRHSEIALMMEAIITSGTSVNVYQTAQFNAPEDSHLHAHCHI
jgi:hypothetical protein